MKKLMLIGGGEVGRGKSNYETKEIDEEIVKMTEKDNPNFLFIGLASSFSDSYYDTMKKIYKELGCTPVYLKKKNMINNPDLVEEKINNADIIYICGGDTIKLMNDIKEYKLDRLIKEAYNNGTVIAGMSAGAILISKEGFSDARILREESDKHEFVKGLKLIDISICPHYHENNKKDDELKEVIKDKEVYGLENCTALKIIDDKISVIKSNKDNNIYLVNKKEEKLIK